MNETRIGKGKRPPLLPIRIGPGPATYVIPSKVGSGPKALLHGKRTADKEDEVPGPGAYSPDMHAILEKYPAIALSTGPKVEKDYSTRKDVPGPGHYALSKTFTGPKHGYSATFSIIGQIDLVSVVNHSLVLIPQFLGLELTGYPALLRACLNTKCKIEMKASNMFKADYCDIKVVVSIFNLNNIQNKTQ